MGYRCPTCTLENTAFSGWGALYLCRGCGVAFCDRCNEGDETETQCPACHAVANPKRGEAMVLTAGETKVGGALQVKLWKIMHGSDAPIEAYGTAIRATAFPNHPAEAIYKAIENATAAKSPKERKELLTEGGRFHSWNNPEIGPGEDRGFRFGLQFLETNMPLAGWKFFVAGMEHGSDRAFWAYFDQGQPFFQEKYHAEIKTHLAKRLEKNSFDATPGALVRAAAAVFAFAPELATAALGKLKIEGGAAATSQAETYPAAVAKALLKLQPWFEQTQQLDLARAAVTYCHEHTAWDLAQHVAILPWLVMLRAECYAPLRAEWQPRLLAQVIVGLARDPLPAEVVAKISAEFPELQALTDSDRTRMLADALKTTLSAGLATAGAPGPDSHGPANAMYALVGQFGVVESPVGREMLGDLPARLVEAVNAAQPLDAVLPLAVKLHTLDAALSLRCLEKWSAGQGGLVKPDRWLAALGELCRVACAHAEWEAPFLAFLEALYARGWAARMSCSVPAAEYLNGLKSLPPVVIRKRAGEAIFAAVLQSFQAIDARQQGPFTKALPELAEPAKYNLETTAERDARLQREEAERKRREEEERRRLAEEERKRKEAEERARLAAEAKAREEAAEKARRAELERIRQEAELRAKAIAEEEARKAAAARALQEEEAREKAAEEAKKLAEEVRQKAEALARIRAEAEARHLADLAKQRAEGERLRAEAEQARLAAEARAQAEAAARAKAEAEARAIAELEARARAEAEAQARAKAEAEAKARAEAEARARAEAERKRQEAEAQAQAEAEARAKAAEAARLAAAKAAQEKAEADAREIAAAEAAVRAAADEAARSEAEQRRRAAEESRLKAESEAKAAAAAAAQAAENARLEAEALKRKTDEERLQREAEEKARIEAEELARAEAHARAEAEAKTRADAEAKARTDAEAKARALAESEARAREEASRAAAAAAAAEAAAASAHVEPQAPLSLASAAVANIAAENTPVPVIDEARHHAELAAKAAAERAEMERKVAERMAKIEAAFSKATVMEPAPQIPPSSATPASTESAGAVTETKPADAPSAEDKRKAAQAAIEARTRALEEKFAAAQSEAEADALEGEAIAKLAAEQAAATAAAAAAQAKAAASPTPAAAAKPPEPEREGVSFKGLAPDAPITVYCTECGGEVPAFRMLIGRKMVCRRCRKTFAILDPDTNPRPPLKDLPPPEPPKPVVEDIPTTPGDDDVMEPAAKAPAKPAPAFDQIRVGGKSLADAGKGAKVAPKTGANPSVKAPAKSGDKPAAAKPSGKLDSTAKNIQPPAGDSERIMISCNECNGNFMVPRSYVGKTIRCPACKAGIAVYAPPSGSTIAPAVMPPPPPVNRRDSGRSNNDSLAPKLVGTKGGMIQLTCGFCEKMLAVSAKFAGQEIRCPECEFPNQVPKG